MRNAVLLVVALVGAIIVLIRYTYLQPQPPARPPGEVGTPQFSSSPVQSDRWNGVPSLEWDLRYHVGMSHDQIRQDLPRNVRSFISVSRPPGGWDALQKDEHGVAQLVREFEAKHPVMTVWACDFFQTDGVNHFLFYDGAGALIGFERVGGTAVLSAGTGRANLAAPVNADARLFELAASGAARH